MKDSTDFYDFCILNNDGTFTAREHVMGKSGTLNILSCERVFIEVENWIARCSRTIGLISPQNENL